jgi:hypothetical protein
MHLDIDLMGSLKNETDLVMVFNREYPAGRRYLFLLFIAKLVESLKVGKKQQLLVNFHDRPGFPGKF